MEQHPTQHPAERFGVLDGMRGVAAFSVMIYHFTLHNAHGLLKNAYIAVDIFFILSGFVLMHSYAARLAGGMGFATFMRRRVVRLYPAFALGLLLGAPIFTVYSLAGYTSYSAGQILQSLACNFLFLPYFNKGSLLYDTGSIPGIIFPANNILWTLFFEMAASMVFVLLARCSRGTLVKIALACFALNIAFGFYFADILHSPSLITGLGWNTGTFAGGFPRVFYGFTCGMALYLSLEGPCAHKFARRLKALPHKPLLLFAALLALFAFPYGLSGAYYFLAISAAPLLVLAGALMDCGGDAMRAACAFMGRLSYPLYCLHYPIGLAVYLLYGQLGLTERGPSMAITATLATLVLSTFTLKYYEGPARRFLAERLTKGAG